MLLSPVNSNATVYEYDLRGNQTYEGGGTYPVTYVYDAYNSLTNMTTYRAEGLQNGDTTTWLYDEATGLLLAKTYADGNGPSYTYADTGELATRTWARGVVTTYSSDGWNQFVATTYSDDTPSVVYVYDALGRPVAAADAAGTTTTAYDACGDVASESTTGLYAKTLVRHRDAYGRDLGYTLDNSRKNVIEYEEDTARLKRVMFAGAWYTYGYLPGTDLKASLAVGTAGRTDWTYETQRDLLTQVKNTAFGSVVSQYDYVSDALGRRTEIARSGARMTETRSDAYGYNDRSELTNAVKNATLNEYAYQYDDIGNRLASLDLGDSRVYQANSLNQYTSISNAASTAEAFVPQYDLDGNQTLVRTTTGDWSVTYNGENRPVSWSCGATNIVMSFDRMGRRVEYLETTSAEESVISDGETNLVVTVTTNAHYRFVYDGYLCIQRLNAAANNAVDLAFGWDPTEPIATRPLWMQRPTGSYNFFCFHDGNKNVSDIVSYQSARGVPAHYEYAPFGAVTAATTNTSFTAFNVAETNPFRFSSEYADDALGLVYYNYRHYNTADGRWMNYDRHNSFAGYVFVMNDGIGQTDYLGLEPSSSDSTSTRRRRDCIYLVYAAHGVSDPEGNLFKALQSREYADTPNGDRYGYWGCGANVFNQMTKDKHPGFELPVVLPKDRRVDNSHLQDLLNRGIEDKYARNYETFSGPVHPTLTETVDGLKKFAKDSGDLKCLCSSVTIKVECSNAVRNAEVFDFLKEEIQEQLKIERRSDSAAHKRAYELYFDKYREKLKCGTTVQVE